jgi:hypothetical protein
MLKFANQAATRGFLRRAKHFLAAHGGNFALTFALIVTPLAAAVGAAIDYSRLANSDSRLQEALDAAVLSAAIETGTEDQRKKQGQNVFDANTQSPCMATVSFTFAVDEVSAKVSCAVKTTFLGVLGISEFAVNASAAAGTSVRTGGPCILVLEPKEKESLLLNANSFIDAPDCDVQVNSSNPDALFANSASGIDARKICVDGGWATNSGSHFDPKPVDCDPVPDPLIALPVPSEANAACSKSDFVVTGKQTLSPGVYCGNFELNAGAEVTFKPGTYVVRDGEFVVNSGSSAFGKGVFFYLTGNINPRFNINSDSHIDFSAPVSGAYAGIIFFQSRTAVADFSILNSDSSSKLEGTIYLPKSGLHLNSVGSISDATPWTAIVVDTLEINSHSILHVNTDYSGSSVPVPAGLGATSAGKGNLVYLKK